MMFSVRIPGEPPTWNSSYRITRQRVTDRHGQPVLRPDGEAKYYSTLSKTRVVAEYQRVAAHLIRVARPSSFQPTGDLIVAYEFDLLRLKDVDNLLKALGDTLQSALDINDRKFLPVTLRRDKSKDPGVTIHLYDATEWQVAITKKEEE